MTAKYILRKFLNILQEKQIYIYMYKVKASLISPFIFVPKSGIHPNVFNLSFIWYKIKDREEIVAQNKISLYSLAAFAIMSRRTMKKIKQLSFTKDMFKRTNLNFLHFCFRILCYFTSF